MDSISHIVKKLRENRILNERVNYTQYPKEKLIKMAQDGDQLAVETLIKTHQDLIRMVSSKYFFDSGDRNDVLQIATIAFWDAIMSYRRGDFEAFAGMLIKRKLTDALRSDSAGKTQILNRATRTNVVTTPEDADDEDGLYINPEVTSKRDLEDEVEGREGFRELVKFMETSLSDTERDVIRMYIKGYKVSEIAEELNMKYKSAENALMRVKGKVSDYLRRRESQNESKKMEESESVEFTDEEKRVIIAALDKIEEKKNIRESLSSNPLYDYEDYTEEQFDEELDAIRDKLEDIVSDLKDTDYDDREDLMDALDELSHRLILMEEYLTDEQYEYSEKLRHLIHEAEDTEYEGISKPIDPYAERGLHRWEFY